MDECPLPGPPPSYDPEFLVETWLVNCEAHEQGQSVDRFARYAPEVGWQLILTVLELPDAHAWLDDLAGALKMLIARFGHQFIDRIESESSVSALFRECLQQVHPDPTFSFPEDIWPRLSAAAGLPIGPMAPHMAALYADLPDLSEMVSWDPHPLDPDAVGDLTPEDIRALAGGWIRYQESFWAWDELHRIVDKEDPNHAWPLILDLVTKGSDRALLSIGAGPLEDLLQSHGPSVIEWVEAEARADQRFRFCLSHVWPADIEPSIWNRVLAARGDEPQRG